MVKKLTASGKSVCITDHGQPLWLVSPAPPVDEVLSAEAEAARVKWIDEELDAVLREPKSKVSAAQLILESRGW